MRKNLLLTLGLGTVAILAACNMNGSASVDNDNDNDVDSSSSIAVMDSSSSSSIAMDSGTSSSAAMDVSSESAVRVIDMTVTNWAFAPAAITAKVGEKVVVRLTGIEGKHSFAIADLGINVPIEPGETKDIELPTDKAGSFQFRCRIPCGEGHSDMTGTFTVS